MRLSILTYALGAALFALALGSLFASAWTVGPGTTSESWFMTAMVAGVGSFVTTSAAGFISIWEA